MQQCRKYLTIEKLGICYRCKLFGFRFQHCVNYALSSNSRNHVDNDKVIMVIMMITEDDIRMKPTTMTQGPTLLSKAVRVLLIIVLCANTLHWNNVTHHSLW